MKNCLLAVLLAPPLAWAQVSMPAAPDPADPAAAVPSVTYRSAFAGAASGVETATTPWPQANADVGQFRRGHIDLLKWEEREAPASNPAQHSPAAADPHAHHRGKP